MSDTTRGEWLVWMWQHYSLTIIDADTQDEAIGLAVGIEDNGDGSLHCIEGPEGVVPESAIEAYRERRYQEWREEAAERVPNTHRIDLTSPNGEQSAAIGFYTNEDEAQAAFATIVARFGDRAKMIRLTDRTGV